ncbi:MAG: hypothetical protein ACREFP_09145 [Acetobacteraceae bacterium]
MATPSTTTQAAPAPEPGTQAARRIAERILADLERSGRRAQADRLAEILLLLADGAPLIDPLPAPPAAE